VRKLVHLLIHGSVQGVGYRAFVALQAEMLGIEGWVRNRKDGTVEAVAAGDAEKVDKLIRACREGPPGCRVSAIDPSETNEEMLAMRTPGEKFALLPTI
jgi:acylphosphatase